MSDNSNTGSGGPPNRGSESAAYLSIGDVSRLTGVSVYTLRAWERRYGHPLSEKLPKGHRRYERSEVDRLIVIRKLLKAGAKPSQILTFPLERLETELEIRSPGPAAHGELLDPDWVEGICGKSLSWEEDGIRAEFDQAWQAMGPVDFVQYRIAPLLEVLGQKWSAGELSISEEHYLSALIETFLTRKSQQLSSQLSECEFVLATLNGESHGMGLLMCATVIRATGAKVHYAGTGLMGEDIARIVRSRKSLAVCLSMSRWSVTPESVGQLQVLRSLLPEEVSMYTGGSGAPEGLPQINKFNDFVSFYEHIKSHFGNRFAQL